MRAFSKLSLHSLTDVTCIVVAVIIYSFNKLVLIPFSDGAIHDFSTCYLNDLACPFLFLGYSQLWLSWCGFRIRRLIPLLLLTVSAGLVWEVIAPIVLQTAIGDPLDMVCYVLGSFIYYSIHQITHLISATESVNIRNTNLNSNSV